VLLGCSSVVIEVKQVKLHIVRRAVVFKFKSIVCVLFKHGRRVQMLDLKVGFQPNGTLYESVPLCWPI
jgi:hypothetical protein